MSVDQRVLIEELLYATKRYEPGDRSYIEEVQLAYREMHDDEPAVAEVEAAIKTAYEAGLIKPDKTAIWKITYKGRKHTFR